MDCLDHYYRVQCKLLSLFGQWPYQNLATKVTRTTLYVSFIVMSILPQTALIVVAELDFNMRMEITCCHVTVLLVLCRSLLFNFNQNGMMKLLEDMKRDWLSLTDKDEHAIFIRATEEAKSGMLRYMIIFTTGNVMNLVFVVLQSHLKNAGSMNGTSSRKLLYQATYFIDEEKYYYLIMAHMFIFAIMSVIGIFAADSFFVIFMYHAVGMFKIVCYRLEHVFDNCHDEVRGSLVPRLICQRTARAVEWHKSAIRFRDGIVLTTQWLNFVSVILTILAISLALYWVFMSKGGVLGWQIIVELLAHSFFLTGPAQKIADSSVEISDKAYSSLWYMAPAKKQTLILLTMQRGLRPCYMLMGKIHPITHEYFGMVLKTAFSYFTALQSLK